MTCFPSWTRHNDTTDSFHVKSHERFPFSDQIATARSNDLVEWRNEKPATEETSETIYDRVTRPPRSTHVADKTVICIKAGP